MTQHDLSVEGADFLHDYLTHDAITRVMHTWASRWPDLVRVTSIGRSEQGRDLWLLTLGEQPDRVRPTVWIDGNMHATELSGSSVALAIAADFLRVLLGESVRGLPAHVCARLRHQRMFVLPRMCPDGAEAVLRDGRYVRSNPRDKRPDLSTPRWRSRDVDGDGTVQLMRVRDPSGEFVESAEVPGLLVAREIEDEGPFYRVFPEGVIEPWDGRTIPDPHYLSDNDTDMNRNFPYAWKPEPHQVGAGRFPLSEPESRAVVEFTSAHPEVFAWLNLHTYGGVYIRPLGDQPDRKLDAFDRGVFRQLEQWGEQYGGYPMVSGYEEFLYEPEKPLHGDLSDYAFHQRGAIAFVCEIWDLFRQIGMEKHKPFVDHYAKFTRADMVRFGNWDREHNKGRVLRLWRDFDHPQLGRVEVGGLDPRVGVSNPPYEMLEGVCNAQSAFMLRVASLAPSLEVESEVHPGVDNVKRVVVRVRNTGYLPTYVLGEAKKLPWNTGVVCKLSPSSGSVALVTRADALRNLGHLEGWGRGRFELSVGPGLQRSDGTTHAQFECAVTGTGELHVVVEGVRTGAVELKVIVA